MPITSNYVTAALATQVAQEFPDAKIYLEHQTQNIKRPCFFIHQIRLSHEKRMNVKYRQRYRLRITWLPPVKSEFPRAACEETGFELLGLFRLIDLPDLKARPSLTEYEVIENELKFTLETTIYTEWLGEPDPKMVYLTIYLNGVKWGGIMPPPKIRFFLDYPPYDPTVQYVILPDGIITPDAIIMP